MKVSEARRSISGMFPDPMQRLATDWPNVTTRLVDMGETWERVRWEPAGPVILLHPDLLEVQARYAITHACEHLDRGQSCEGLRWRVEHLVNQAAARWLIPSVDRLGAALAAYEGDRTRVAWEFWVPPFVVGDRLAHLDDEEQNIIDKHRDAVA